MDHLSESNQNFYLKSPFTLLKTLSSFIAEKQTLQNIASHIEAHYLKNTKEDLPILYILNNQLLLLHLNKEKSNDFFDVSEGNLIANGSYNSLFSVNEKALKIHLPTKDAALIKKNTLSLEQEASFLSKIHENPGSIGIQKKISLKKVYDICHVKEKHIESLRETLPKEDQSQFEIHISEGVLYNGTLENFIQNHQKNQHYQKNILEMQRDLSYGLDLIHNLNIMHGDIKHKNIFYELKGTKAHAYLADFGSADKIIPDDFTNLISSPLYCSLACTRGEDIGDYNSPAKLLNALISKKTPLTSEEKQKIHTLKTHCKILRKQIDIYQLGVAFYQMAIKHTRNVPYPFLKKLGPQDIDTNKVKNALEFFYKDEEKIHCILLMLNSDPRKRPSAKKIKEVFSLFS